MSNPWNNVLGGWHSGLELAHGLIELSLGLARGLLKLSIGLAYKLIGMAHNLIDLSIRLTLALDWYAGSSGVCPNIKSFPHLVCIKLDE